MCQTKLRSNLAAVYCFADVRAVEILDFQKKKLFGARGIFVGMCEMFSTLCHGVQGDSCRQ